MAFNTQKFEDILFKEATTSFKNLAADNQMNDVYVVGFYHTGGWDAIWPIYNTANFAKSQISSHGSPFNYRWAPDEFEDVERYYDALPHSEHALRELGEQCDDSSITTETLITNWQETLSAMNRVLKRISDLGIFKCWPNAVLYVASYDDPDDERWARIQGINTPEIVNKVRLEFESEIEEQAKIQQDVLSETLARFSNNK